MGVSPPLTGSVSYHPNSVGIELHILHCGHCTLTRLYSVCIHCIDHFYGIFPPFLGLRMVNMLENHRLRSTFDFEKAVSREWDLFKHLSTGSGGEQLSWNFHLLDLAAGKGTAVDTIFMLKEAGTFRGAKRRLRFAGEEDTYGQEQGAPRVQESARLVKKKQKVEKSMPEKSVYRASVSLKMSK